MKRLIAVVAFIAISVFVGGVAIPNLVMARNRSREKRTLADIRAIATAWEARATDRNTYSVGFGVLRTQSDGKALSARRVSASELQAALAPTYIRQIPRIDGWGNELQFTVSNFDEVGRAQSYAIRSVGNDAKADPDSSAPTGVTGSFAADVIYSDGAFLQYPEEIA